MRCLAVLAFLAAVEVSRPAPELVVTLPPGGKQLLLSQLRGKIVALEFLSTTCQHCQKCAVALNAAYQQYGAKGFEPLGVAFNQQAAMLVPDFVKEFNLKFPVGVAAPEQVFAYLQPPPGQPMRVPQLMFVDRKGIIRAYYPAGDKFFENEDANLKTQIEALLKEQPPAAPRKRK